MILWLYFLLVIIANWVIFEKANEAGWKSLVPIYSAIVFMRIIGVSLKWWLIIFGLSFFTLILPIMALPLIIATLYLSIVVASNTASSFGKSGLFAVGLYFITPIFLMVIAFGNSEYLGTGGSICPFFDE